MSDFTVSICSLRALPHEIADWRPTTVVSLVPVAGITDVDHLALPIDDIYLAQLRPYRDAIRRVLEAPSTGRMLFNCQHGKSRSAAMALIKIYQHDPDGISEFLRQHPEAEPNPLLLILGDDLLEAGGDLWRRCRAVYKGRAL